MRTLLFASLLLTLSFAANAQDSTQAGNAAQKSAFGDTAPAAPDPQENVDPWAWFGQPIPPSPPGPDKSGYNLFNPTPDENMRPFSTDRPGKTHSSLTVDAGHFQLETDFANYTYDHYSPGQTTTRDLSIATPLLKAGVTNWADLEIGLALYNSIHSTQRTPGSSASTPVTNEGRGSANSFTASGASSAQAGSTVVGKGFGDILLGTKMNVFGNDGGNDSLAILPFVKIPSASNNVGNDVTEYTVNAPYQMNLDTLWSITLEPAFGWLRNTENTAHHGEYTFLVNVNRPVFVKTVTASLEVASEYASHDAPPRYTLDPALQWLVAPDLQLDMGAYVGLNKAAPDYQLYTGISFRY